MQLEPDRRMLDALKGGAVCSSTGLACRMEYLALISWAVALSETWSGWGELGCSIQYICQSRSILSAKHSARCMV